MFVFAKVNYRKSVRTKQEVLISTLSTENLFRKFLNNFLFFKKNQKLKTTFSNFGTFIISENVFGYDIYLSIQESFFTQKETENAIREI